MKLDKELIIGLLICGIVLVGWQPFSVYMGFAPSPTAPATTTTQSVATPTTAAPVSGAVNATKDIAKTVVSEIKLKKYPTQKIENQRISLTIDPNKGSISAVTLKDYLTADRKSTVVIDQAPANLQPGSLSIFSKTSPWKLDAIVSQNLNKEQNSFNLVRKFSTLLGESFVVSQSWSIGEKYDSKTQITITNPTAKELTLAQVIVSGGELELWASVTGDKMRVDKVQLDYLTSNGNFVDIAGNDDEEDFFTPVSSSLSWVALNNKYFISILKGEHPFSLFRARAAKVANDDDVFVISSGALLGDIKIPANSSMNFNFDYYTGPKIVADLKAFAPDADKTMHLAWGPLNYLARLLLWALVTLNSWFGSYGWSIIVLTLIVRLLFYPVTARANTSMKRMSSVQPKIQELRTKYKDNPQLLNSKMMELYREEKINPFGGCLPILLQIPVFFALYETLNGAVELRQVPFLWSKDLAAPDTVAVLFGSLPINPLVIAMTLLMVLQQRMTPSTMDPTQRKMMLAMPLVMLFFLYDLPSGLTLYWTVSQIFSIIQLLIQQKFTNGSVNSATAIKKS